MSDDEEWECPDCYALNEADDDECYKCGRK